jgi:hypothetical protein
MRVMPGGALEADASAAQSTMLCGPKLDEHRGAFLLEYPMEAGVVQSWDAMEVLWEVSDGSRISAAAIP